jgi:hypothetical protein
MSFFILKGRSRVNMHKMAKYVSARQEVERPEQKTISLPVKELNCRVLLFYESNTM